MMELAIPIRDIRRDVLTEICVRSDKTLIIRVPGLRDNAKLGVRRSKCFLERKLE